jgi:hypothetical protein
MLSGPSPDAVPTGDLTGGTMPYANNLGTFAGPTNGNLVFLQYLLHLRAAHAAFRQQDYSMPIAFANADGSGGYSEWSNPAPRIYLSGRTVGDADFVLLCNLSGVAVTYTVPTPPAGTHWVRLIDTNVWAENACNSWGASVGQAIVGTYGVGNQSAVLLEAVGSAAQAVKTP